MRQKSAKSRRLHYGMVIVLFDNVTAADESTRPFTNVSLLPSVIAPPDRMVPIHTAGVPRLAEPTTQNTLLFASVAVPPNTTVDVAAGVNAPIVRKMYTPAAFRVKFTTPVIAASEVMQYTPGAI